MGVFDWFRRDNAQQESKELLVSRQELEEFIDGKEDLKPYNDFLKQRWLKMVIWWHNRSVEARWKYFFFRRAVVVGGVLIPVLSTLNMKDTFAPYAPIAIAIVGAFVAGCAAWEGIANYGEIWRGKRRSAELLKVEGWQFFQLCGKYQDDGDYKKAFPRFAAEVEDMIAKEVGEYFAVFGPSLEQSKVVAWQAFLDLINDVRKKQGYNENESVENSPKEPPKEGES